MFERQGPPGPPGRDGEDGERGKDGRPGVDGRRGPPGFNGRNGTDGRDGINGKDGLDAVLPPIQAWRGMYEHDEVTKLTQRILSGPIGGDPMLELVVYRDADQLIAYVDILPLEGGLDGN